jgi:glycosyltransferase 2 family protein
VIALGVGLLAAPLAYLALAAFYRGRIGYRQWSMQSPPFAIAVGQVVIGTTNFAMVAACLHQTLSAVQDVSYPTVASVYAIANATAIATHVPGGLGVIEGVVLFLLPGAPVVAALIAFRVIYFFVPLPLGGLAFAISEFVIVGRADASESAARGRAARGRDAADAAIPPTASEGRSASADRAAM